MMSSVTTTVRWTTRVPGEVRTPFTFCVLLKPSVKPAYLGPNDEGKNKGKREIKNKQIRKTKYRAHGDKKG
jgi:hypothetical protein